jgi:DNA-binding GntR family transcriptional regulator
MKAADSKAGIAYDYLDSRILDGTYGPGFRLIIAEIARETGLSNIPVREAISRLEAEGLVETRPNVGARVVRFTETEHRQSMSLLARIEGFATAESAPHITEEDLAEARVINARSAESLKNYDPMRFSRLNKEFHEVFFRRCPDIHLRSLLTAELQRLDLIRRSVLRTLPGRPEESIKEHEHLITLIESRSSSDEIEAYACQHRLNGIHPAEEDPFA